MNLTASILTSTIKERDITEFIPVGAFDDLEHFKHEFLAFITTKHPSYWKRLDRISGNFEDTKIYLDLYMLDPNYWSCDLLESEVKEESVTSVIEV